MNNGEVNTFLNFHFAHNAVFIEALFVTVLVLFTIAAIRAFMGLDKEETQVISSGANLSQIEETLKNLLAQGPIVVQAQPSEAKKEELPPTTGDTEPGFMTFSEETAAAPAAAPDSPPAAGGPKVLTPNFEGEIAKLRGLVKARDEEIKTLQAKLSEAQQQAAVAKATTGTAPAGDTAGLQAKIKELEGRLAEYEIIEDDIADLNQFKEENGKLKKRVAELEKELASAKGGGGAQKPAGEVVSDDLIAEFAAAVGASGPIPPPNVAKEVAPAPASAPTSSVVESEVVSDDLMAEFAAAVDSQKSGKLKNSTPSNSAPPPAAAPIPQPTPTPQPTPAPQPAPVPSSPAAPPNMADDPQAAIDALLAANSAPVQESTPPVTVADETVPEAAAPAPAPAPAPAVDEGVDLGVLDIDKMVSEATDLGSQPAPELEINALDQTLDENRLMAEAADFGGAGAGGGGGSTSVASVEAVPEAAAPVEIPPPAPSVSAAAPATKVSPAPTPTAATPPHVAPPKAAPPKAAPPNVAPSKPAAAPAAPAAAPTAPAAQAQAATPSATPASAAPPANKEEKAREDEIMAEFEKFINEGGE